MANWERLAEQSQIYSVDDLRRSGYRLMMEQVIYATDRGSRATYDAIVSHMGAYRDLLGQLGMTLIHNPHMSYLVAVPDQYVAMKMRLSETRLALILRRLYDDRMHATDIVNGEAYVSVHDLEAAYKDLLNRNLPEFGELKELLAALKRYGLVRLEDATDEQPFTVVIRPGIEDVLGETALLQLAGHAPGQDSEEDEA